MDKRRAQLLELGLRLFSSRSYDGVSIEDIARAARVSKGLLYHYFGGKRAFYRAVVEEAARRLLEAIEPDPSLPPVQRAAMGLDGYLRFVEEREDAYIALVTGGIGRDAEVSELLQGVRHQIADRILREIGLPTPPPAFRIALRSWIGGIEAACIDWLAHRDLPRAQLLQFMVTSLMGALASANATSPVEGLDLPRILPAEGDASDTVAAANATRETLGVAPG